MDSNDTVENRGTINQMTPGSSSESSIIKGRVTRITFRNEQSGYTVFQVRADDTATPLTITGYVGRIEPSYEVIARGSYTLHPRFGRQFAARAITATVPASEEGLERYLVSSSIPGIGPDLAKRVVEHLGERALEIIRADPLALTKIPGIGKTKAEAIVTALSNQSPLQKIIQFLVEHGVSAGFAEKIYNRYGDGTIDILQKNPYKLARDVKGIGFQTADRIATAGLGMPLDAPERLKAGLAFALDKAAEEGHCFLTEEELITKAHSLLQLAPSIELAPFLIQSESAGDLVREPHGIYTRAIWTAEQAVITFVGKRRRGFGARAIDSVTVNQTITEVEHDLGLTFSVEQSEAIEAAASERLLVITGGPGCGKTTTIRALATLYRRAGRRLMMAAPTGRAAQRMSQVCDIPATTIHRLLRFNPHSGDFIQNEDEPLLADAVIVDECSMLDVHLAASLFAAIPDQCILILVGDKDQLPSVGPGKVFGDIIESGRAKVIRLTQLYRRSASSTINDIAISINAGINPIVPIPSEASNVDAYFIPKGDPGEAMASVLAYVSQQLPVVHHFDPSEIMVLTPSNKGPLGTIELNQQLQSRLNPAMPGVPELVIGSVTFRLGDRVCQRSNNYQIDPLGVFNGDIGIVSAVDPGAKSLTVTLWDGRKIVYKPTDLAQLGLAYALTVHRSQGSEIPCVVLVLHDSHYMLLERQLVYTAVTRAKKFLIIVGSKRAMQLAVSRVSSRRRNTGVVGGLQG